MTTRFHTNPTTGDSGPCHAKIKCRFGGDSGFENHFDTIEEAREAFESSMKTSSTFQKPLKKKEYTEEERQRVFDEAFDMGYSLEEDWLPEVELEDGSGYVQSLMDFKDYKLAANNCSNVASCVSDATGEDYGIIEENVNGPFLMNHVANIYTDEDGKEWVIDYTYSQVDPHAEWPWVGSRKEWLENIHHAAYNPSDEMRKLYEDAEAK